jgi:Methyltransferase small domain
MKSNRPLAFALVSCFLVQYFDCLTISPSSAYTYSKAWRLRIANDHTTAQPLFRALLESNPSDWTASTRIAASSERLFRSFQNVCAINDAAAIRAVREAFLRHGFHNTAVSKALHVADWDAAAPIFVKAAAAGTVRDNLPFKDCSTLEVLILLFILGLAVPRDIVPIEARNTIDLLLKVGLIDYCEFHGDVLVPLVAITPMDPKSLFFVTDWHPQVLGLVRIDQSHQPVMYIGPDSLALTTLWQPRSRGTLLDLCTGCGVQGLYQVAAGTCTHATLVDVNPRAVRFAEFNAALNGLDEQVTVQQCDICDCELSVMIEKWRGTDMVTANPPFLPVPDGDQRHGLYSAGGPSGDRLLLRALEIADGLGAKEAAIVSEFFFDDNERNLVQRIRTQWTGRGLLVTNEHPLGAEEYAKRRADSPQELKMWLQHLKNRNIQTCSPGLLLLERTGREGNDSSRIQHVRAPRSELGSLWTPGNYVAEQFCKSEANRFFN